MLQIKWESARKNTTGFEFRCCENKIERPTLIENGPTPFQVLEKNLLIPLPLC